MGEATNLRRDAGARWGAGQAVDTFELTKLAGAVLVAAMVTQIIDMVGNAVYGPEELEKSVYVATTETEAAAAAPAEGQAEPSLAALLAAAEVDRGRRIAKKCAACHDLTKGGPNKIGPNLWGMVGAPKAHREAFAYSTALSGLGGTWTYDELFRFLENPKAYAPKNKMVFPGVKKPADRADLIAYLRSLSDSPPPLPAVE